MNKTARRAMLILVLAVAPALLTGCSVEDVLSLLGSAGGTGAGPVASQPRSGSGFSGSGFGGNSGSLLSGTGPAVDSAPGFAPRLIPSNPTPSNTGSATIEQVDEPQVAPKAKSPGNDVAIDDRKTNEPFV